MKSKVQKKEELEKGRKFLEESQLLVLINLNKLKVEDLKRLRRKMKDLGANLVVIKKRLLNLLLKEKGINYDSRQFKCQIGTIFSLLGLEEISGPIYKFFLDIAGSGEKDKDLGVKNILGGYDLKNHSLIEAKEIELLGKLPPRKVILGQLLTVITSSLRSFLYVLNEKSKRS